MKKFYLACILSGFALTASAQVGINNPTPDNSAVLDLTSNSKGLLIPRMDAFQRVSIPSPAVGLMVYQTDLQQGFWYYTSPGGWTFLNPTGSADNLGNHTATQNLGLNNNWLSNDGGANEGLRLSNTGRLGVNVSPGFPLHVRDTLSADYITAWLEDNNPVWSGMYVNAMKATAMPFYGYARQGGIVGWHHVDVNNKWSLNLLNSSNAQYQALVVDGPAGNVGIGSYTPLSRLSITPGTVEAKITLWDGGNAANHYGFGVSSTQLNYHVDAPASSHVFWQGGRNGNGTELMRIRGNGRVGIGTATPRGKFDVDGPGDVYLVDDPEVGTTQSLLVPGHMYLSPYNGSDVAYLQARRPSNTGSMGLRLRTHNNGAIVEAMHLDSTGRVGISTNEPLAKLDIQGGANHAGTTDPAALAFSYGTGGFRHWIRTRHNSALGNGGNAIEFYVNNSNFFNGSSAPTTGTRHVMTLDSYNEGRVGINTTAPQHALHVVGNTRITGLGGSGSRMVVTDNDGTLSTQALSPNTDNQTLGLAGNTLSISGGNSVALPALTTTAFNPSGTLSISTSTPSTVTSGNAAWLVGGNTLAATGIFGTLSNNHVDLYSNNIVRGRFSNLGEFFIGTTSTALAGDLMAVQGNAAFPWAISGYTTQNGSGVYGLRQSGAVGTWGSVMGETASTIGANNSGVSGMAAGNTHRGVVGQKPAGGTGWGGLFLNDLGYTGFFGNASDERVKKNIQPISGALQNLKKLKGATYQYAEPYAEFMGGDRLQYGFIAQEIESVYPDMVQAKSLTPGPTHSFETKQTPTDIKAVSTISLIPVLVEGIKEQQQQIEAQQRLIEALEARLKALEKK